ncbi:MAG: glycosyltransferase family 87 protein [Octadecabacter sp.]
MSEIDDDARIFPYIYPPIWAKLVSLIVPVTTFATFDRAVLVVHQTVLVAMIYLVSRMCALRGMTQLSVVCLTYTALASTLTITLALAETQPHILVSFLIVFAFERAHFGHGRSAGARLACAAAIKGYPLLFLVIFAARRQWPPVTAFVLTGGALALASVALVGGLVHAEYISLIIMLSRSVIVTNFSLSLDAYIAGLLVTDDLLKVGQPRVSAVAAGWTVLAKPAVWAALSGLANVAGLICAGILAARRPYDPLVLPVVAILLALLSPLSWAYTYLTALVFTGAFAARVGPFSLAYVLGFAALFHRTVPTATFGRLDFGLTAHWILIGLACAVLGLAMLWAILCRPVAAPMHKKL